MTTRRTFLFHSIQSAAMSIATACVGEQARALSSAPGSKELYPKLAGMDADIDVSQSELRPYIERFDADSKLLKRYYYISSSPRTKKRFRTFYTEWQERLLRLDYNALGQDGRIDHILLNLYLAHELRQLDLDTVFQKEVDPYTPFAMTVIELEESRLERKPVQPEFSAKKLADIATVARDAEKQIEGQLHNGDAGSTGHSREAVNRAVQNIRALRQALHTWFEFYDGYNPMFTWWAAGPYKDADAALEKYQNFLQERVLGLRPQGESQTLPDAGVRNAYAESIAVARPGDSNDIIGHAIGRDALITELNYSMIPYTPEELISIANKEFAWCDKEMLRASRDMGFGDDWKKALEKVKNTYVEPGKQPELGIKLVREGEKFVEDHELVTVPPMAAETWGMRMIPPAQQLVSPFFLGGEILQISYPTDTMTYDQRISSMRANNIAMSRAVAFHEMIPGHELQGFMAQRYRTYRSIFRTAFFTEGWALYWEMLLFDMGFDRTPEERVGALEWRMHRCARIIFSINFHLGNWLPEQCIDFLVSRVGWDRAAATGEVRRSFGGAYSPLYQAGYLLGGMQIYALHRELVASGKLTNRQFHDAVLRENNIPIEMIRASLTHQTLTRDFHTQWKFYGDVTAT